jgi:hypothetical protein
MHRRFSLLLLVAVLWGLGTTAAAHDIIVKGTVARVEPTRIQIRTGAEKPDEPPAWIPIERTTVIKRGEKVVSFADARIRVDERVVAIIDHPDKGPSRTKEIRLAAD